MGNPATKRVRRRTCFEWCDEDDWQHHLMFGQLHLKVWESWLKYPILVGYHPKRTCRVGEEGYSCISIIICPCINSFYIMWQFRLLVYFTFLHIFKFLSFKSFGCLFFLSFFLCFASKIQKYIKSIKSKKFDQRCCALSHACLALYLRTNGFVH